jgi:CBS domain-containing protein
MRAGELMRTNYLSVSVDDTVSDVVGKLEAGSHHSAVVVDTRDRYVGLFDKEGCVRSRGDVTKMKVRNLLRKTSVLEESSDLERVARLLFTNDVHVLPVLDKYKRVAGIVGARDVMLALIDRLRGMTVGEVATRYPVVLQESESVARAIDIVRRKRISRVPVVDENRKLVGVITLYDLLVGFSMKQPLGLGGRAGGRRDYGKKRKSDASTLSIRNVMKKAVETVEATAPVQQAVRRMAQSNISDLVVIEGGVPVGMLTTKDILKVLAK